MKRKIFLVLPFLFTALFLFSTFSELKSVSAQEFSIKMEGANTFGTGFTYQGRLSDASGQVSDTCDFQFSLWNALSGPGQLGTTQGVAGVTVEDGLFNILLNSGDQFGNGAFNGNPRWIQIAVRCPAGVGGFTTLIPRQPLTPAPYAHYSSRSPWDGLVGIPAGFSDGTDDGDNYANVVVVAKTGGDYTSIQSALDSITGASEQNHYLVWIAPGVYTETVTMKPYVDIEGSGRGTTKITFGGSPITSTGTVIGSDNAELRDLEVENTGGDFYAVAIYNNSASPSLLLITATAFGGNWENVGVFNVASNPQISNVIANASGGSGAYGVYNFNSSATVKFSYLQGITGGHFPNGIGLNNVGNISGTYTVTVNHSQLIGDGYSVKPSPNFNIFVGGTYLEGAPPGGGILICAGVYDENYTFYTNTCP